jgi:hypothetical protein
LYKMTVRGAKHSDFRKWFWEARSKIVTHLSGKPVNWGFRNVTQSHNPQDLDLRSYMDSISPVPALLSVLSCFFQANSESILSKKSVSFLLISNGYRVFFSQG